MCNLYALTKGQQALRDLARALERFPIIRVHTRTI
jgi:hypothetical protein